MRIKQVIKDLQNRIYTVDWILLAFLLLFLNVKLLVKVAAIVLIYIFRFDLKMGFGVKHSRLPLFYLFIIVIAVFNWLISGMNDNLNYNLVFLTGLSFWLLCIMAIHQVKLSVEKNDPAIIHRTIFLFFMINVFFSLAVYFSIIAETGHINPYRYQGLYQKYFIGTGDYIKGITQDTSITNAVLNAFGLLYFLLRKNYLPVLLCMIVLLLTGSNVTNLILCIILLYLFIFQTNRDQKSMIIVCLLMLVVFWAKTSPQNNAYITDVYQKIFNIHPAEKPVTNNNIPIAEKPDSILTNEEKKQKIAQLYIDSLQWVILDNEKRRVGESKVVVPVIKLIEKPLIPIDSIHTPTFQHKNDTSEFEKKLLNFIAERRSDLPLASGKSQQFRLPGKLIALEQTFRYFKQHPLQLFTGIGVGNFSSKLAFRVTSMNIGGGYPERFSYINDDFKRNHLDLYLYYFTNSDGLHSLIHSPNSTYDQLLSEYGFAGLLSFFFLYIGYFVSRLKKLTYGIPLLLFMLGIFFVDYWFEQLSVVIFLELLILLNIKERLIQEGKNENN